MSKPIVYVLIIVIAALTAGGAYHYLNSAPSNPTAPALSPSPPAEKVNTAPTPPRPTADHGNFQKRFQPTVPPSGGDGK